MSYEQNLTWIYYPFLFLTKTCGTDTRWPTSCYQHATCDTDTCHHHHSARITFKITCRTDTGWPSTCYQHATCDTDSYHHHRYATPKPVSRELGGFNKCRLLREWRNLYWTVSEKQKAEWSKKSSDDMWIEIGQQRSPQGELLFPELTSLVSVVRTLPHSNAKPERTFSVIVDTKNKKRNKLSAETLNAICVLKSALKARNETSFNMAFDDLHFQLMLSDNLYSWNKNTSSTNPLTLHLAS